MAAQLEATAIRTLVEVAIENAVEGCVRETYGAAVAAFQGECARDLSVRRAMRTIAVDEAEHASLAWAINTWARPRLTPKERAQVEATRGQASAELIAKVRKPASPELSAILGLPTPAASAHLIATLAPLWS